MLGFGERQGEGARTMAPFMESTTREASSGYCAK